MNTFRRSALRLAWVAAMVLMTSGFGFGAAPSVGTETPQEAKPALSEMFQKGPIGISAKVVRKGGILPLFQAPVLRFQDRLELTFSGEAFDLRVTQADWTLVVVFLPRTVAPTEKGIVSLELSRKPEGMVAAPIAVPYDSIPMLFLVPDSGGRRKILADLNAHLAEFRNICLKLSDLAEQRVYADRFLKGLEAIRQDQSAPSYDHAVFNFFKAYGGQVSQDLQIFLNRNNGSNLEKFQFLVSEFKRTNLLVPTPDAADRSMKVDGTSISGNLHPASLYIAIAFDLMQVFQNLWPGHKFQYVPALARDFEGMKAQLFYDDWIHTTGDIRGALVFSPCRWKDADLPEFQFELPPSECILRPHTLLKVQAHAQGNSPLAMFGHDWHLALKGPKGESLDAIPLTPNPNLQAFVIEPSPALLKLQAKGWPQVQVRIEGTWGFQSISTPWKDAVVGVDPGWKPSPAEVDRFMLGQACTFKLPSSWGRVAAKAHFRREGGDHAISLASLKAELDGSSTVHFDALPGEAGPGFLEVFLGDSLPPALSIPLTLQAPLPVVERVIAHQGEPTLLLTGRHLRHARGLLLGDQTFAWTRETPEGSLFTSSQGALKGDLGTALEGTLKLADGRSLPVRGGLLMPPRPMLQDLEVISQTTPQGLPLIADTPLIPISAPVLLSGLSGRKGHFPLGRAPKVLLRNTEEPAIVVPVPGESVKLAGRGQRLMVSFKPLALLGTRSMGSLEWQVQDDAVGSSAWIPLPAVFLELPTIQAIRQEGEPWVAEGQGIELIEATASTPKGPWLPAKLGYRDDKQATICVAPDMKGTVYLRLIGWPDLSLRVQIPHVNTSIPPRP